MTACFSLLPRLCVALLRLRDHGFELMMHPEMGHDPRLVDPVQRLELRVG